MGSEPAEDVRKGPLLVSAPVAKVTEVSGHFHVEPYEAMGIVDDDGHMVTFDELLPVGEGKRGRFKVTV